MYGFFCASSEWGSIKEGKNPKSAILPCNQVPRKCATIYFCFFFFEMVKFRFQLNNFGMSCSKIRYQIDNHVSWWKNWMRRMSLGFYTFKCVGRWPCHANHSKDDRRRLGSTIFLSFHSYFSQCKQRTIFTRVECLWHQTPLTLALALSHQISIFILFFHWMSLILPLLRYRVYSYE